MDRFVGVVVCLLMAFYIFRDAVAISRGQIEDHPILRDLDMARRKNISRFYSVVSAVFAVDIVYLAAQIAVVDSAELFRRHVFVFLVVAAACILASHVFGRYWFRRR